MKNSFLHDFATDEARKYVTARNAYFAASEDALIDEALKKAYERAQQSFATHAAALLLGPAADWPVRT